MAALRRRPPAVDVAQQVLLFRSPEAQRSFPAAFAVNENPAVGDMDVGERKRRDLAQSGPGFQEQQRHAQVPHAAVGVGLELRLPQQQVHLFVRQRSRHLLAQPRPLQPGEVVEVGVLLLEEPVEERSSGAYVLVHACRRVAPPKRARPRPQVLHPTSGMFQDRPRMLVQVGSPTSGLVELNKLSNAER